MFEVVANLETTIAYGLKYLIPYKVYAVHRNEQHSTIFLFYINHEWRWIPAKGFEPNGKLDYYATE